MTWKFDGWPLKTIGHLFYTTWGFVHHFKAIGEFKLELQSGNALLGSKLAIFLSHVTLQFDRWPWKTTGHLFYTTWSFVHHSKAIGEFKLQLQSGNAQLWSKLANFLSRVTLKFDGWHKKNNRAPLLCYFKLCASFHSHLRIQNSYSPETHNLGQNRWFFVLFDLEIWQMTSKNNRAPLLCYLKLYA